MTWMLPIAPILLIAAVLGYLFMRGAKRQDLGDHTTRELDFREPAEVVLASTLPAFPKLEK